MPKRPERPKLRPERADLRPERADLRPDRADSRRADFRLERLDDINCFTTIQLRLASVFNQLS